MSYNNIILDSELSFAERFYFSSFKEELELEKDIENPRKKLFEIKNELQKEINKGKQPEQIIRNYIKSLDQVEPLCANESLKINRTNCVSSTGLFLSLAEMLDYDLFIKCDIGYIENRDETKTHTFVRKTNNSEYENIDFGETVLDISYIEEFGKLPETHPKNHINGFNLYSCGSHFLREGNYKKAKKCYEKAIEIIPTYTAAMNNIGCIYQILGNSNKALDCFNNSLKINPQSISAQENINYTIRHM